MQQGGRVQGYEVCVRMKLTDRILLLQRFVDVICYFFTKPEFQRREAITRT